MKGFHIKDQTINTCITLKINVQFNNANTLIKYTVLNKSCYMSAFSEK